MKPEIENLENSIDSLSRLGTEPDEFKIWLKSFLITRISNPLTDFSLSEYPHEYLFRINRVTSNVRFQERLRHAVRDLFRDWNINASNTESIEYYSSLLNLIADLPISEVFPDLIETALSGFYCGIILENQKSDVHTLILRIIASFPIPLEVKLKDRLMDLVEKYIFDIWYTPLCFRIAWQIKYENAIRYIEPLLECSLKRKFDIYGTIESFLWGCGVSQFKNLLVSMLLQFRNNNMLEYFLKILFKLGVEIHVPTFHIEPFEPYYLLMKWKLYDQPASHAKVYCKNHDIITQIDQFSPRSPQLIEQDREFINLIRELLPSEILVKGDDAIEDYAEELEKAQKPLNELKVLLVGDGGAGKTSLMKRLIGAKFDPMESKTHGINLKNMTVNAGGKEIKINIWDFGGQQIMHFTHQFFLSKRSLYILVLDGRKDEKTEYWLKHIESFGGDSPVLVVLNKIDENYSNDLNRKFLKKKYRIISDFYRVSCKSGAGIDEFLKGLKKSILQIRHLSTVWPKSWFNVKNKLENMEKDFISYDEYAAICVKENIKDKAGQDTLVDFLHDLGAVLHFKDFKLKTTHILAPEWITTAVYKIINSRELSKSKGILELKLLDGILKQKSKDDYYYPPDKYTFIVELMKKFELCYERDSETILIPDLLEIQEPDFEFDYSSALKFVIEYDFLPRSIIPRFIVRVHHDIKEEKEKLHWRTGVILDNEIFKSIAIIKTDEQEQRIYIYVNGLHKNNYFQVIRHTLLDINADLKKLGVDERIPLPDNPDITVDFEHLIFLKQNMVDQYIPEKARKSYSVNELLKNFEITDSSRRAVNTNKRLGILDQFDDLIFNCNTTEKQVHQLLIENLWILGTQYAQVSSNKTLQKMVEDYLGKKYEGDDPMKRPDLLLVPENKRRYLLIELKRPNHALRLQDEYQAIEYRKDLSIHLPDKKIEIILIGGKIDPKLSSHYDRPDVQYKTYKSLIGDARNTLTLLLKDLE